LTAARAREIPSQRHPLRGGYGASVQEPLALTTIDNLIHALEGRSAANVNIYIYRQFTIDV